MSVRPQWIIIKTSWPYVVTPQECEGTRVFTNEWAAALVDFNLSLAIPWYEVRFIVQNAFWIQVSAAGWDTINGVASITSLNVGDIIDVYSINATEWIASIVNGSSNTSSNGNIWVTTWSWEAGENISIGEMVVYGPDPANATIYTYSSANIDAGWADWSGQAITVTKDLMLNTVTFYLRSLWVANTTSIDITAAAGIPWSTGTRTWPSLFTSNSQVVAVAAGYSAYTFTFPAQVILPAGNYAFSASGSAGTMEFGRDASASTWYGNYINNVNTPDAASDLAYIIDGKEFKYWLSDASTQTRIGFVGIASNTVVTGWTVTFNTKGDYSITPIVSDSQYFLTNTPWTISVTAGTFPVEVWRGVATDILRIDINTIQPSYNLSSGTRYFAGIAGNITWSQHTTWATAWAWSADLTIWDYIDYNTQVVSNASDGGTDFRVAVSYAVKAGKRFKVDFWSSGGGTVTNNVKFTPIN